MNRQNRIAEVKSQVDALKPLQAESAAELDALPPALRATARQATKLSKANCDCKQMNWYGKLPLEMQCPYCGAYAAHHVVRTEPKASAANSFLKIQTTNPLPFCWSSFRNTKGKTNSSEKLNVHSRAVRSGKDSIAFQLEGNKYRWLVARLRLKRLAFSLVARPTVLRISLITTVGRQLKFG